MWDMPWTDSALLVEKRVADEFLKRRFGNYKAKLTIPINWIEILDIFTSFRLQDPYGFGSLGEGEYGRYYYVESLTYDFQNQKIDIMAVDLQFILRQCMIIPHCGDVAETWEEASEEERMFAYVGSCATESFSDGEPLKKVCPCNRRD